MSRKRFVKITDSVLRSCMTTGIGLNNEQAKLLGVYPLRRGWKRHLIGSEISEAKLAADRIPEFVRSRQATGDGK